MISAGVLRSRRISWFHLISSTCTRVGIHRALSPGVLMPGRRKALKLNDWTCCCKVGLRGAAGTPRPLLPSGRAAARNQMGRKRRSAAAPHLLRVALHADKHGGRVFCREERTSGGRARGSMGARAAEASQEALRRACRGVQCAFTECALEIPEKLKAKVAGLLPKDPALDRLSFSISVLLSLSNHRMCPTSRLTCLDVAVPSRVGVDAQRF